MERFKQGAEKKCRLVSSKWFLYWGFRFNVFAMAWQCSFENSQTMCGSEIRTMSSKNTEFKGF